jgi:hypothetical protein
VVFVGVLVAGTAVFVGVLVAGTVVFVGVLVAGTVVFVGVLVAGTVVFVGVAGGGPDCTTIATCNDGITDSVTEEVADCAARLDVD